MLYNELKHYKTINLLTQQHANSQDNSRQFTDGKVNVEICGASFMQSGSKLRETCSNQQNDN